MILYFITNDISNSHNMLQHIIIYIMLISGKIATKLKLSQPHRKTTRRFHTQADQPSLNKPISRLNLKNSQRLSSKPKYLQINQKYKQPLQPRKTTFKMHAHKYVNKHLRTQPDQCYQLTTATNTKTTLSNKYEIDGTAGKGTFGVVYCGHVKGSGIKIAIKKVLQDKRYKNRQLQILKMLRHSNILQMRDFFMTYQHDQQYLNVVMDYYPQNLYQVIKKRQINNTLIKIYTYQILRGLNYLNMIAIAHRDIKPQNILVDRSKNKVVICDFGSAKQLVRGQTNLAYICSRCYRAPELIFGATDYTSQIDMWSLGCVLVEMINGDPPFLGQSQIDQLLQIIKTLGTPTKQEAHEMNRIYDTKQLSKLPNIKQTQWKLLLRTKDLKLIDLVNKILVYSPLKRLTAAQALKHSYFDDLRDQTKYKQILMKVKQIPELFDFSKQQLISYDEQQKVLPKWVDSRQSYGVNMNTLGVQSIINPMKYGGTSHLKKGLLQKIIL